MALLATGKRGVGYFHKPNHTSNYSTHASSIGRLKISWDEKGITLAAFPKKPRLLLWQELEKISLDHLGYHVHSESGQFKIRKNVMPDDLLYMIRENIRINTKIKADADL